MAHGPAHGIGLGAMSSKLSWEVTIRVIGKDPTTGQPFQRWVSEPNASAVPSHLDFLS